MSEFAEPGSRKWVQGEAMWGLRSKAHAVLRLLVDGHISERKALSLLRALDEWYWPGAREEEWEAPWEELEWNPGPEPDEALTGEAIMGGEGE